MELEILNRMLVLSLYTQGLQLFSRNLTAQYLLVCEMWLFSTIFPFIFQNTWIKKLTDLEILNPNGGIMSGYIQVGTLRVRIRGYWEGLCLLLSGYKSGGTVRVSNFHCSNLSGFRDMAFLIIFYYFFKKNLDLKTSNLTWKFLPYGEMLLGYNIG